MRSTLSTVLVACLAFHQASAFRGLWNFKRLAEPKTREPSDALWFEQKLDHFDPSNHATWQQRYWSNMDNYEPGGPVLIWIGGEGEANPAWLMYGSWYKYAQDNKAAMFMLEHRYYGASHPVTDMAVENMKYLSSRQALEDLAAFMTAMNVEHELTGPWVSFGGSYPGSLSAWLKLKFPHLLRGAVSSSGPLHAKLDFHEYLGVVKDAMDFTGIDGCNEAFTNAITQLESLLADENSWEMLGQMFKTCKPLDGTVDNDIRSFVELLIDNLAGIVQYNGRFPIDIFDVCEIMTNEDIGSPLERYAELNAQSLTMYGSECLDHEYATFLSQLTDTDWSGGGVGWRQWIWQTCTEFGWYQTTNQPDGVYGSMLPLEFFESWCQDAFGEDAFTHSSLEQTMVETNTEYGGFTPAVENVVFVHGSVDPWHAMGVLEDLSEKAPAIFIPGTSHCADLYPDMAGDPTELTEARQLIGQLVAKWISE